MVESGGDPMALVRVLTDLLQNDPLSAVILLALFGMGALITGAAAGGFGLLSAGGVLSALSDLVPGGRSPPER